MGFTRPLKSHPISSTVKAMANEELRGLKWSEGGRAVGSPLRSFADAVARVRTMRLANGLEVVVWPDHNIPNVALHNWVRVGSRNEGTGRTGLAHFFEHMMFNGTSRRAQGEFDRLMESQGGSNNAYTSQDVTVYQDWFPRSALELVFELESDRIANLAFDTEVVENERKVVYSERRLRVEDSNAALLDEQVQATAFRVHPYRIPTIGWPADIQSWTMADLTHFYRTYYAPNNCTLILVGDLEADEAFKLAQQSFGAIPRGEAPPPILASRHSTSCKPFWSAATLRACIARWSKSSGSRWRLAAVGPRASIRMCLFCRRRWPKAGSSRRCRRRSMRNSRACLRVV